MKHLILIAAVASLSACMGGASSNKVIVTNDTTSCANNPYMQSTANLPVRCGPQTVSAFSGR